MQYRISVSSKCAGDSRRRISSFIGGEGRFLPPGEVAKISGARFMWPWTIDWAGVLEDTSSTYSGCSTSQGTTLYKVKQGKLGNCQGNTFYWGRWWGARLWCQVQSGEGANWCSPHVSRTLGYYGPTLVFEFCFSKINWLLLFIHLVKGGFNKR